VAVLELVRACVVDVLPRGLSRSGREPWEGWAGAAAAAEVERHVKEAHAERFALDVPLHTAPTDWDPATAIVTLNLQLDGALVRSGYALALGA
jgi:hypothetical protein